MKKPRVLLADDHTLVLEGITKLLESEFDLVGAVEDGRALIEAAHRLKPDVILLDISMPVLNGVEAARQLRRTLPRAKLVFLTVHGDASYVAEALREGASGYVLKRSVTSEVIHAIREVLKGRSYVTPLVEGLSDPRGLGAPAGTLTKRQREVLQLIAEGHSQKEIASRLRISPKTVEFHAYSLMERLGLRTVAELTKYAVRHGFTEG